MGRIAHFRQESGTVRPRATFRCVRDDQALYVRYDVEGNAPAAEPRGLNGTVCLDSCCEVFLQPAGPARGYMNFEVNAAGVLHASHILNPKRVPGGFEEFRFVTPEDAATVDIMRWRGNTPATPPCGVLDFDETQAVWGVAVKIPLALVRRYTGAWQDRAPWRANFFICQENQHGAYWAAWSEVAVFNFHTPEHFGVLEWEA